MIKNQKADMTYLVFVEFFKNGEVIKRCPTGFVTDGSSPRLTDTEEILDFMGSVKTGERLSDKIFFTKGRIKADNIKIYFVSECCNDDEIITDSLNEFTDRMGIQEEELSGLLEVE